MTIELNIEKLGPFGEGIAFIEDKKIFVNDALPGEIVRAKITVSKESYARAELVEILQPSKERVDAPCPLFGKCGGCQIMHLCYPAQLKFKEKRVKKTLKTEQVNPCIPSPKAFGYRNKIQLCVKNDLIGLYARGSNDIIETPECLVHSPIGEKVFKQTKERLSPLKEVKYLLIKTAIHTKQAIVTFVCNSAPCEKLKTIAKDLFQACDEVVGVIANINREESNTILGKEYITLAGQDHMSEMICGLSFKVSPASFFQVNTLQAEALYTQAINFLDLKGDETVLDAYCGVGTLTLLAAKQSGHIVGIEWVQEAIIDAKENAQTNNIDNCRFICGDAAKEISNLDRCDAALLNPPRKGCGKKLLDSLLKLKPKKIVYVSCNPETLGRDIEILQKGGYSLKVVQPFDMFPQTMHVETVALLILE